MEEPNTLLSVKESEILEVIDIIETVQFADSKEDFILGFETEMDDNVCEKCKVYNGQTFTRGEAIAEFPYLEKGPEVEELIDDVWVKIPTIWYPMVHPHCRCRLIVIRIKITIKIV